MITTAAFNRAYGWSGDPIWVAYRAEHLVIGPASHGHAWVDFAKDYCTAMGLQVFSAIPQRGSRKCGTLGAWFSEPPNKELGVKESRALTQFRSAIDRQIQGSCIVIL
jgi:hypothetical protein